MTSLGIALQLMLLLTVTASPASQRNSMNVNIQQPHSQMYHQQSARNEQFTYGYNVHTVSNQFQHKVKGPDEVTYGCYGYIDPTNKKHIVYYVADPMGYRIIFPNRPTKIYTEQLSDSLNKLDGAVRSQAYREKIVAWNDLYLPEPCFLLSETLDAATTAVRQQIDLPEETSPVGSQSELNQFQTTPASHLIDDAAGNAASTDDNASSSTSNRVGARLIELRNPNQPSTVQFGSASEVDQVNAESVKFSQTQYSGGPDIDPALINLDQYNINSEQLPAPGSVNISLLLSQIEAVNSQVITLNMILSEMSKNPTVFGKANEGSCNSVVQLLRSQRTSPQLIYVPILIPYIQGQYNINQPFGATFAYVQEQKPCERCG